MISLPSQVLPTIQAIFSSREDKESLPSQETLKAGISCAEVFLGLCLMKGNSNSPDLPKPPASLQPLVDYNLRDGELVKFLAPGPENAVILNVQSRLHISKELCSHIARNSTGKSQVTFSLFRI